MAQPPRIVSWNLTRRCNLACGHCYLDAVQRKSDCADELSTAEALRVVEELGELAPGAMLVLTGGEPLLRRDLDELVQAAAARDLMPVIGSNGTLLTAARAAALRRAGAAGVGISVDSADPAFHDTLRGLPGAWAGAVGGMRAARQAGLGVLMQTTLFAGNRNDLDAFAQLAREEGAMALNFFFLVCTGRGVTQTDLSGADYEATLADILRLQSRHAGLMIRARCAPYARRMLGLKAGQGAGAYADWSSACLAGRSYFRITPEGKVTACPYIPQAAGDLRRAPLRAVWDSAPDFLRLRGEMPGGKCGGCDYRVSCGGCRARSLAMTGDLMGEDAKCAYVPAADAVAEAPRGLAVRTIVWAPDAQALLERIPGFVRSRVRDRLEEAAVREAAPAITLEFMRAHRPQGAVFSALRAGHDA